MRAFGGGMDLLQPVEYVNDVKVGEVVVLQTVEEAG